MPCFGAMLDAAEHPALHDEVRRLEDEQAERRQRHGGESELPFAAHAHEQSGRRVVDRYDCERAPAIEYESAPGDDLSNSPAELPTERTTEVVRWRSAHEVSDADRLPLGHDAIRVMHRIADETLEPRIAVEATAILPDLREPWPHGIRRRVNRYAVVDTVAAGRNQLVSRQLHRQLGARHAPAHVPGPQKQESRGIAQDEHGDRGAQSCQVTSRRMEGNADIAQHDLANHRNSSNQHGAVDRAPDERRRRGISRDEQNRRGGRGGRDRKPELIELGHANESRSRGNEANHSEPPEQRHEPRRSYGRRPDSRGSVGKSMEHEEAPK